MWAYVLDRISINLSAHKKEINGRQNADDDHKDIIRPTISLAYHQSKRKEIWKWKVKRGSKRTDLRSLDRSFIFFLFLWLMAKEIKGKLLWHHQWSLDSFSLSFFFLYLREREAMSQETCDARSLRCEKQLAPLRKESKDWANCSHLKRQKLSFIHFLFLSIFSLEEVNWWVILNTFLFSFRPTNFRLLHKEKEWKGEMNVNNLLFSFLLIFLMKEIIDNNQLFNLFHLIEN